MEVLRFSCRESQNWCPRSGQSFRNKITHSRLASLLPLPANSQKSRSKKQKRGKKKPLRKEGCYTQVGRGNWCPRQRTGHPRWEDELGWEFLSWVILPTAKARLPLSTPPWSKQWQPQDATKVTERTEWWFQSPARIRSVQTQAQLG